MHELFLLIAMMVFTIVLMGGLAYLAKIWMTAREVALKKAGRTESDS